MWKSKVVSKFIGSKDPLFLEQTRKPKPKQLHDLFWQSVENPSDDNGNYAAFNVLPLSSDHLGLLVGWGGVEVVYHFKVEPSENYYSTFPDKISRFIACRSKGNHFNRKLPVPFWYLNSLIYRTYVATTMCFLGCASWEAMKAITNN